MVRILAAALNIAFGAAGILHGAGWQIETVDQAGPGRFSSMKVDNEGNLHIAYVAENDRHQLKYAFRDLKLKRWFTMTLSENAGPCSLVLDGDQRPHVSWVDFGTASGSKLRYVRWNGKEWIRQVVPIDSDIVAYYNSIALDAKGNPSISFYEYRGPRTTDFKIRLRTAAWKGEYWLVKTIDSDEGSGKFNSMAVDEKGRVHIAYANVSTATAGMRYALWDGQSWRLEIVDGLEQNNGDQVGYSVALALDRDGNPHLVYTNQSSAVVKYAVRIGGRWRTQVVERLSAAAYPDRNSIALDENGHPYLGYFDAGLGIVKVAYREGDRWMVAPVRERGGFTTSLQVDRGTLWISYADEANAALKVAYMAMDSAGREGAAGATGEDR